MTSRTGKISPGFTFVEVMLTTVILSFGLVIVLQSFATALEGIKRSASNRTASYLIEEKMEELKEKAREEQGLADGPLTGEFDPQYGSYKWNAEVKPGPATGLSELGLLISWSEGNKPRSISAVTYVDAKK